MKTLDEHHVRWNIRGLLISDLNQVLNIMDLGLFSTFFLFFDDFELHQNFGNLNVDFLLFDDEVVDLSLNNVLLLFVLRGILSKLFLKVNEP